ncbi:MAG: hypothetical protein KAG66_16590, partial [Methylococcales bacterium]|nr:hypothetical protein [Methylococcales bacterium]
MPAKPDMPTEPLSSLPAVEMPKATVEMPAKSDPVPTLTDWLAAPADDDDITPDWLEEMVEQPQASTSDAEAATLKSEETADWLSDILPPNTGQMPADTNLSSVSKSDEFEDMPDWLSEIAETGALDAGSLTTPAADDSDWLTQLAPPETPEIDINDSGELDGLTEMAIPTDVMSGSDADIELAKLDAEPEPSNATDKNEGADWLTDLGTISTPSIENDVPDSIADAVLPTSTEDDGTADWLAELDTSTEFNPTEDDGADWLAELDTMSEAT